MDRQIIPAIHSNNSELIQNEFMYQEERIKKLEKTIQDLKEEKRALEDRIEQCAPSVRNFLKCSNNSQSICLTSSSTHTVESDVTPKARDAEVLDVVSTVSCSSLAECEEKGLYLIENNQFFSDLSTIMENHETVNFFEKYFKDFEESKAVLVYIKLYTNFKQKYKHIKKENLSKYLSVYLLHYAMSDHEIRSKIIQSAYEKLSSSNTISSNDNLITN